ncbi:MAG: TIGR04372 family glycosyltransferase [Sediminibacterium sp.]
MPVYLFAIPVVIFIRLIRPWFLVRFIGIFSERIGHFAGNTELYLCECDAGIDKPATSFADICFFTSRVISNQQLATMWRRTIRIWPSWLVKPIEKINRLLPGWEIHNRGENARDLNSLLDKTPPHLNFTREEEIMGQSQLAKMEIPAGVPFVCLLVRDDAYLNSSDWNYHNYRDSSIENYILASEELAARGYYVIRMGQVVRAAMNTANPKIIDYAVNGMRSDFMDIYLGAKCEFCITTGAGWDAVPSWLFRKPTVFTNLVPFGFIPTFSNRFLITTKKHIELTTGHELSVSEIFEKGVAFCMTSAQYQQKEIRLAENSPEELRDVAVEMTELINNKWTLANHEKELQDRFWKLFLQHIGQKKDVLHGDIKAYFSTSYLLHNQNWMR